ncbi:MAG: hypothetical protein JNK45_28855 [Myxococcales bacterium]|nr:hypothetical protein [Myxococcales bacterium]
MSTGRIAIAAGLGLVGPWVCACGLDSSGLGHASGTLGTATAPAASTGEDSTGDAEASTTAEPIPTTTATSATSATSATGEDTSSTGDVTDTADLTTGPPPDPCLDNPPITLMLDAAAATLVPPMTFDTLLDGTGYFYSETANEGAASFEIDLPCGGEFMIWADVYDGEPGPVDIEIIDGDPADAIRIEIGGIATDWLYGCQTPGIDLWSRQALSVNANACITNDRVVLPLVKGAHTLTVTALEAGAHSDGLTPGDVAAVARVFITNVQDVMP